MKKIYLAIPYSGMEEESYKLATRVTAKLMSEDRHNVFSPITHCHPMTKLDGIKMPGDWAFWKEIDLQYIDWADEMIVIIPAGGYNLVLESTGVQAEIDHCGKTGKNVTFMQLTSTDTIQKTVMQPNMEKYGTSR